MEALFRQKRHKNHKGGDQESLKDSESRFPRLATVTHTSAMTEEKWMGLEVEQKQEMGTVGNLCAVEQANSE